MPHTAVPRRPENRQPTVLLIEDDEDTRFALAHTFARQGYLVRTAPTGHDAVGIVRGEAAPIDVVLLDVGLPDVSGADLCARLHELRPGLPVVVCSGEATRGEAARLCGLGVRRYFQKPIEPDELLATVEAALRLTAEDLPPLTPSRPPRPRNRRRGGAGTRLRQARVSVRWRGRRG
jgi:DNA-binding response OmpR family regulator